MTEKLSTLMPKIVPLLRMLSSAVDGEVINSARALLRVLTNAGLDIHVLVEWIEHGGDEKLRAGEMQKIYDAGYEKGHADGAEMGRRSAIIASAIPMIDTSDVGPGVNGHSWLEIAQHCATNKHRLSRDRDREFIDSVFEQMALRHKSPTPAQAKWLRDIFTNRFGGRVE